MFRSLRTFFFVLLFTSVALAEDLPRHRVEVYYLYKMPRCQTCLNIEAYSKAALDSGYAAELQRGIIVWHAYDTDVPEYEHFWNDFKLESKSLVMVELKDGEMQRWKVCEKVWDLVGDPPAFKEYVKREVAAYLKTE